MDKYAELRYGKMVPNTVVQTNVKEDLVMPLVSKMKDETYRRLGATTPEEWQDLEKLIGSVFDVHKGIESEKREDGVLRRGLKIVAPVSRRLIDAPDKNGKPTGPRRGDVAWDMPMKEELESWLQQDPSLLAQLRQASDEWARSKPAPGSTKRVYVDVSDGDIVRNHPGLGAEADRSDGSIRLAFILYYDDLEVVNPLGAFHGTHKLGMFYWACANVEQSTRMAFHNLHLMTVALVSDIDYYGIAQIVSGFPGDSSFGSAMTELDAGMVLNVTGAAQPDMVLFRGWCTLVSADFPAAALCAGFKKSVSANSFCRECNVNQSDEEYPCPNSFMQENEHLEQEHLLRELADHLEQAAHFMSLRTKKERDEYLQEIGVNTFTEHAFGRVPYFDVCTMIPYDFMHVELEGSLKNELACLIYIFHRKRPGWGFTVEKLNARMREYAWPGGFAPPPFTTGNLYQGTTSGLPKTGCHVHMTSGDMMVFARHSIDLLLPLIEDQNDPVWKTWVAHIKYFNLLLQHSLTEDELLEVDELIYEHHQLFLASEELGARMFKPKNHMAGHFPPDARNHGPVRGYWCMRFEALNQLFKTFAKTGSFRNTCFRCADFWSICTARQRGSSSKAEWGSIRVETGDVPMTYQRFSQDEHGDIVKGLFEKFPAKDQLVVQWIEALYCAGSIYYAGSSWLSGTYDGVELLAFVQSLFKFNGKYFARIRLYPRSKDGTYGTISTTVPSAHDAEEMLMSFTSDKLENLTCLWPSVRYQQGDTIMYRFVKLQ